MKKPRMTRQHFELIAQALSEALNYLQNDASWLEGSERTIAREAVYITALILAKHLSETNEAFSFRRFMDACGFN
jgi:hypothetical protein